MKKHFSVILLALLLSLMCAAALGETNTQSKHKLMLFIAVFAARQIVLDL